MKAKGAPAMLLPPPAFAKIEGLALYPDQPVLQDSLDQRSGALSATRTDGATYMLQRAGDYTLPPIDVAWWSTGSNTIERLHADAIILHVADNPALRASGSPGSSGPALNWHRPVLWLLDHWRISLGALLVFCLAAYYVPAAMRVIRHRLDARRNAYLASEGWSFDQFRAAARRRDQERVYFALLDWLKRFAPLAPKHTIEALRRSAQDPALDLEIESIETNLFGPQRNASAPGSTRRLLKRVTIARRLAAATRSVLPGNLNPIATPPAIDPLSRPVAR
jgi:hypothetical protein